MCSANICLICSLKIARVERGLRVAAYRRTKRVFAGRYHAERAATKLTPQHVLMISCGAVQPTLGHAPDVHSATLKTVTVNAVEVT